MTIKLYLSYLIIIVIIFLLLMIVAIFSYQYEFGGFRSFQVKEKMVTIKTAGRLAAMNSNLCHFSYIKSSKLIFPTHLVYVALISSSTSLLPRCMECRSGLVRRILSVCPSVRQSIKRVICDKTEDKSVQIFIPYERSFSLVF